MIDPQQIVNGLAVGVIYGALGLSLVLIFRSTNVLNFAQGEMATVCAYVGWILIVPLKLPFWIGFFLTLIIAFGFGGLIERVVIRRVEQAPQLTIVIVTFGLYTLLNSLDLGVFGGVAKAFPTPFGSGVIRVAGLYLGKPYVGILGVTLVFMFGVFIFFRFTNVGLAMRASTMNPVGARLMGVNVERMLMLGWGLSSTIGAAAGIFIANLTLLDPNMMAGVLIYAFAAAVLGGLTNPAGAVIGGLVMGLVESIAGSSSLIGSELKTPFAFAVFVAILLIKPGGLWGKVAVTRV